MKVCKNCKQSKSLDDYNYSYSSIDKRQKTCKECLNEMQKCLQETGHCKIVVFTPKPVKEPRDLDFEYLKKYWPGSTTSQAKEKFNTLLES